MAKKSSAKGNLRTAVRVGAALCVLLFALKTFKVDSVDAAEIGFLVNNWTGTITEYRQAGQVVYCGLWNDFHTIENKNLSVDMGKEEKGGLVKLKTADGNDVFVDFSVFYQIAPEEAATVLFENGAGTAYQQHWIRDYSRAIFRYCFGELSTEQFYQAAERDSKVEKTKQELNAMLARHGLFVTQIAVQDFRFVKEYEQKITEKENAKQEIEQFSSQRAANEAAKKRQIEKMEREVENQLIKFGGELRQKRIRADGEAARTRLDAEGYAKRVVLEAQARFHQKKNEAEARLAALDAEARGLTELAKALAGEGGRNLVALEYAKRLSAVTFSGYPVEFGERIQRYLHEMKEPLPTPGGPGDEGERQP